jgi:predicted dehydrogenase
MTNTERKQRSGFAVVGLGKMGIMHAAMLGVVPGGLVAALVDQDAKLCDNVRSMGVEVPSFSDLGACIDQVRPEGVWIATPQFTHRGLFEECLSRKIPVFCEKPLAHTLEDARAMLELARRHADVPVAVGYQMLHSPLLLKAAEIMAGGVLGTLKSFRASCRLSQVFAPKKGWTFTKERAGGGVVINSGVHVLSMLARLFGRPRSLVARGSGVHNEVEDTFGALLDYDSGLWGTLEMTWSVPGYDLQTNDVEVIGTGGTLEVGNQWLRLWLHHKAERYPAGWSQWGRGDVEPRASFNLSPDYCGDEFFLEDKDFVEAVHAGRQPRVNIEMAMLVQEILDGLYRSMASGQPVALTPAGGAA